jgi:polyisoprenoid-binding protein YceI
MTLLKRLAPMIVATTAALLGCVSAPSQSAPDAQAAAAASWRSEPAQSSLSFVTTKAGQPGVAAISEVQTFRRFSGELTSRGQIRFTIDLASVDTGIEIRDERLRTMLFNVGATPQATFVAQIDPALLRDLPSAGVRDMDLDGQLTLAGQSKPVLAKVRVGALGGGRLAVSTRAPIVVNANDFGLRSGVEALREVMALNLLSSSAPVSFALVMRQSD